MVGSWLMLIWWRFPLAGQGPSAFLVRPIAGPSDIPANARTETQAFAGRARGRVGWSCGAATPGRVVGSTAGIGVMARKSLASGHLLPAQAIPWLPGQPAVSTPVVGSLNAEHVRASLELAAGA
jgi:hypothetical protein